MIHLLAVEKIFSPSQILYHRIILDAVGHHRQDVDHPEDQADVKHVILREPYPVPLRPQLLCDIEIVVETIYGAGEE